MVSKKPTLVWRPVVVALAVGEGLLALASPPSDLPVRIIVRAGEALVIAGSSMASVLSVLDEQRRGRMTAAVQSTGSPP